MNDQPLPGSFHPFRTLLDWFRRNRDEAALQAMDAEEMRRLSSDLNIQPDDLVMLTRQSPDEATLMTRMMALHGIDRDELERLYAATVRDMAAGCAHCTSKAQCQHDLDSGADAATCDAYCVNAGEMTSFAAMQRR